MADHGIDKEVFNLVAGLVILFSVAGYRLF